MTLEKSAHLAEIIGSVAIVVTLVILVFEVRGNTEVLQRQINLDRASASNTVLMDSPYLPGILAKIKLVDVDEVEPAVQAFMDRYNLTFEESDRWVRFLRQYWLGIQADFLVGERGTSRDAVRALANSDQALFWENATYSFDEEFVKYVNGLERGPSPFTSQ